MLQLKHAVERGLAHKRGALFCICNPLRRALHAATCRQAAALLAIMQAGEAVEEVIAQHRDDIDEEMLQVGWLLSVSSVLWCCRMENGEQHTPR